MRDNWLDNRYRTIYEYLELGVTTKGETFRDTLEVLEDTVKSTVNNVAITRVSYVRDLYNEIIGDGLLDDDSPIAQSIILTKLRLKLENI